MKSEKMKPLLQSMWLQVLWILWTLWFVLDCWTVCLGRGMAALHGGAGMVPRPGGAGPGGLPVPNLWSGRRDSVHNGDLSVALGHWGWAAGGPPPQPLSAAVYIAGCHLLTISFFSSSGFRGGCLPGLDLGGGPVVLQKISPGGNVKRRARRSSLCSPFCVWRQPGSGAEGRDMV